MLAFVLASCTLRSGDTDPAAVTSAAPASGWVEIWKDDFDLPVIDPGKWEHEINCSGGGNDEAQCYTDRHENSFVDSDGILHLVAREETFSGPAHSQGSPDYRSDDISATRTHTSARLRTLDRLDFRYGRIEVRARLPAGQGTWPAIWLLPSDWVYGGWPSSGEIDIMEAVNLETKGAKNAVHGTLHYGLKWPQWSVAGADYIAERSLTREFHTYALEWEADEMRWYVDGIHYQTQTSAGWYNYIWGGQQTGFTVANPHAPFDQDFHLILNLAIGGHAPGPTDANWSGDRELLIDYVRVYQCSVDNDEGKGCSSSDGAVVDSVVATSDSGAPKVHSFSLYADGPATLALTASEQTIENTLVIRNLSEPADSVVFETSDIGGVHGSVLDINFSRGGSVALSSADMRGHAGLADGFALVGGRSWTNYGTIEFDLFVDSIDPETRLLAQMGNGSQNLGQFEIEVGEPGSWNPVVIRLSDLLANPLDAGKGIDVNYIENLFLIRAAGAGRARIRLDNIRLGCVVNENSKSWQPAPVCSIGAAIGAGSVTAGSDIFRDEFTHWTVDDCCDGASARIVADDVESGRGNVVEFVFQSDETVAYLQSDAPMDFRAVAGGTLEFDLLIVSSPKNPAGQDPWLMTVSCGKSCGTGEIPLTSSIEGVAPVVGVWQHFTFNIDDLVLAGLKLQKVVAPLGIYPSLGHQHGAVIRIDNVVVNAPAAGAIKLGD